MTRPTLKSEYDRGRYTGYNEAMTDASASKRAAEQQRSEETSQQKATLVKEIAALAAANAKLTYAAALILTDKKPFGG